MPNKAKGWATRKTIAENDPMGAGGIYGNMLAGNAPSAAQSATPSSRVQRQASFGPQVAPRTTGSPVVGGQPSGLSGVRADQDLFNRIFGSMQDDGGYVADQVIANAMQNRSVLPSPVSYAQGGLSPNIQRRVSLFSASNPADALRNPPAGPAMARDNGQAISRMTPLVPPTTGSAQSVRGGKSPVPAVPRPTLQQRPGKMPRGGA